VEFDISFQSGTNFQTQGVTGSYIPTSPVKLSSNDPIQVVLTYSDTTLKEDLHDLTTGDKFSKTYNANISASLGSGMAFVGFTGGTGIGTSDQTFSDFTYSTGVQPPVPEPATLVLAGWACWLCSPTAACARPASPEASSAKLLSQGGRWNMQPEQKRRASSPRALFLRPFASCRRARRPVNLSFHLPAKCVATGFQWCRT
jgi:hypothetical protein